MREETSTLSAVAGRLGYESEAAFSRAFKRFMGVSPGSIRRQAQL
ncbi:MAG: helix-turn-helix domain-containing protein [bacterium]